MKLTEQLYFNINKNVVKEIFLYAKNCLLSDLLYTLIHYSKLDTSFLNSYKIKSKTLPLNSKEFIFQTNDFIESEHNKKIKIEVLFEKISNYHAGIIKVSPDYFLLKINRHYVLNELELIKVLSKDKAKKHIDELLKLFYKTIYHELTHIAQHVDKKNKAMIPQYPLQHASPTSKKYFLQEHEFATYLSNTYGNIKRITSSGQRKLSLKEFEKFCKGIQVRGKVDTFMSELYKDFKKKSSGYSYSEGNWKRNEDRWLIAKERLYNLAKRYYIE